MDPITVALYVMGLAGAPQIAPAPPSESVAIDKSARTLGAGQGYITLRGTPNGGTVKVIRDGKVAIILRQRDLKKIRSHPELDFKLQPGDILDFGEPLSLW